MVEYCSDAGIHDSVVVQELLKQVAQNQTLDTSHKSFRGVCKVGPVRVLVRGERVCEGNSGYGRGEGVTGNTSLCSGGAD